MKKVIVPVGVLFTIAAMPSVALASWWNPFTWFGSQPVQTKATAPVTVAKPTEVPPLPKQKTASTDQSVEIENLKKEIEELKKTLTKTSSDTVQNTPIKKTPVVPSNKTTKTGVAAQSQSSIQDSDYRLQALAILNGAKDNYVQLENYSNQSVAIAVDRKKFVQRLDDQNSAFVDSTTLDPTFNEAFVQYGKMLKSEISLMAKYQYYFQTAVPNSIETNISVIYNSIDAIQNSATPVTSDQMKSLQLTYFGTNKFENERNTIEQAIDEVKSKIDTYNTAYRNTLALIQSKIDAQKTANSALYEAPQFNPPTYSYPQLPQTTHCTLSGDGVGLQAYVDCTTGNY